MKLSRMKLAGVIDKESSRVPSKKLAKEVAAYLLSEGRTRELDALLRDILAIRSKNGLVEATVRTAHQVNGSLESQLKSIVKAINPSAKKVIINHEISPELIGGLKILSPDQQLDLSIQGKLNRFKQTVNEGVN